MPMSRSSLKLEPKPRVVVPTPPAVAFSAAVLISTFGSVMPSLAWPSVSSSTRLTYSAARCFCTWVTPWSQPPLRLVQPPARTLESSAAMTALSFTFWGASTVAAESS